MPARSLCTATVLFVGCLLTACGSSASSSTSSQSASSTAAATQSATATSSTAATNAAAPHLGPEGIPLETGPLLAPASSTTPGSTVDGVQCAPIEQLAYHIHAHLQVYLNGQAQTLPAAIGLIGPVYQNTPDGRFYGATQCYYWLHTHTNDGIIHIESPTVRIYTLGNFFDEWHQPLSRTQVAGDKGKVTAFENGKRWTQDPRTIPLIPHASIDLDVGSPVPPPQIISFAGTGL